MVQKKFRWFFFKYFKWTLILLAFLEIVDMILKTIKKPLSGVQEFFQKAIVTLVYGIPVYLVFASIFGMAFGYINWTRHKRAVLQQQQKTHPGNNAV